MKRYRIICEMDERENDNGDWVLYSDAEAELLKLREALDSLKHACSYVLNNLLNDEQLAGMDFNNEIYELETALKIPQKLAKETPAEWCGCDEYRNDGSGLGCMICGKPIKEV